MLSIYNGIYTILLGGITHIILSKISPVKYNNFLEITYCNLHTYFNNKIEKLTSIYPRLIMINDFKYKLLQFIKENKLNDIKIIGYDLLQPNVDPLNEG